MPSKELEVLQGTVGKQTIESKYVLQGTIGAGNFGKAVLASLADNPDERVIIKQIQIQEDGVREDALREAKMLSQFDHVNIIHYYESVLEDDCLHIVMEYASEGDLADLIAKHAEEKRGFTEDEIMFWFVQIVLALYHVHSKNILHRDLKSQNVFISEGNIVKLGDFGISRVLNSDTEMARTVIGTPYYLSPELCEDRPYNRKSDVWALGCVLYELCTLKRAFDGQSLPALVVKILKGSYPPVPTKYSSPLRNIVDSMLKQNPKDRPSMDAILRLSYVRRHVERYAKHVMQLSPLQQPVPLGIGIPAEKGYQQQYQQQHSPAEPTPARSKLAPRSQAAAGKSRLQQGVASMPPVVTVEPPQPPTPPQHQDAPQSQHRAAHPQDAAMALPPNQAAAAAPAAAPPAAAAAACKTDSKGGAHAEEEDVPEYEGGRDDGGDDSCSKDGSSDLDADAHGWAEMEQSQQEQAQQDEADFEHALEQEFASSQTIDQQDRQQQQHREQRQRHKEQGKEPGGSSIHAGHPVRPQSGGIQQGSLTQPPSQPPKASLEARRQAKREQHQQQPSLTGTASAPLLRGVVAPPLQPSGASPYTPGFSGRKLPPSAVPHHGRHVSAAAALTGGGSTWVRQQHHALSELEGAMALHVHGQQPRIGANPHAPQRATSQQQDQSGEDDHDAHYSEPQQPKNREAADGDGVPASRTILRGKVLGQKQQMRFSELEANKQAVLLERARKRNAAAKRTQEAALALRNRTVERQREIERQLLEQRAQEEARQKRNEQMAEELRSNRESKKRLQDEICEHMAAHQAQIKAARARVKREELNRLGAKFAVQMQQKGQTSQGQVLVVDLGSQQGQQGEGSAASSSYPGPAKHRPSAIAPLQAPEKANDASGPRPEPPWRAARAAAAAAGNGASPIRPPKSFPEVHIYTPFGSELAHATTAPTPLPPSIPAKQQQQQGQPQQQAGQPAPSGIQGVEGQGSQSKAMEAWAKRGKAELLEVLSQIQQVLGAEEEEEGQQSSTEDGGEGTSTDEGSRTHANNGISRQQKQEHHGRSASQGVPGNGDQASHTRSHSIPPGLPRQVRSTQHALQQPHLASGAPYRPKQQQPSQRQQPSGQQQRKPQVGGGRALRPFTPSTLQLPPEQLDPMEGSNESPNVAAALRVEELRMGLEAELGHANFLAAYRYLQELQQSAVEEGDGKPDFHSAADQRTMLERLLGHQKLHLVRKIHKLITLEDQAFD